MITIIDFGVCAMFHHSGSKHRGVGGTVTADQDYWGVSGTVFQIWLEPLPINEAPAFSHSE
jgi:hypothetical protein